jgi:hypothetical protein
MLLNVLLLLNYTWIVHVHYIMNIYVIYDYIYVRINRLQQWVLKIRSRLPGRMT